MILIERGHKMKTDNKYKDSGIEWIGEIPNHWEVKKLKQFSYFYNGNGFPEIEQGKTSGDYPFLKVSDINNPDEIYISKGNNYVSKELVLERKWIIIKPNSILFPKIGEALLKNHRKINRREVLIDNNMMSMNLRKSKIVMSYFFHMFKYFDMKIFINISSVPSLNTQLFYNYKIPLPPLPEQKAIAKYLDNKTQQIDKLIENTQSQIEELKEYEKSLINKCVTKGLNENVKLKDSGIEWVGEIPKHWEIKRIKNNTYIKARIGWQGLTSKEYLEEGEYYLVTGTDFNGNTIKWETCHYVEKERYEQDKYIQLKLRDILITKDGTIGKVAMIHKLPKKATLNSGVFVIRPKNEAYIPRFMFWILKSFIFTSFIDLIKTGSTIAHLYQRDFNELHYTLPPLPEQKAIAQFLDSKTENIQNLIKNKEKQIELYQELRKTLVNNAVTGKIKII